jgi:prepilin peptidase CpaA
MPAPLPSCLPLAALCCLLALAVWHDVRSRRIPNWLVFGSAAVGVAINALPIVGALGVWQAAGGWALGLALLMPMYALKTLGAGDVKLMAAIGALIGPQAVFGAMLASLLAGGVLALAVSAYHGTLLQMTSNSYHLMLNSLMRGVTGQRPDIDAPAAPSGKLPYAIAIAAGTVLYLALAAGDVLPELF